MQCACVKMNIVRFADMVISEARMTHACITRGLGTHLLGCFFSNTVVCMLAAVAYIDMKSHVEVVKSGMIVHRAILSMRSTQCKICVSRENTSYAVLVLVLVCMVMRSCTLVMGDRALFTDFLWAESV